MRPLNEEETRRLFEKLSKYIDKNILKLVEREGEQFCFRLQKDKVYYASETITKRAVNIPKDNLVSLGTCLGKYTASGKFQLHITALDYLSKYAKYKIWLKANGEMPFLYGNHVLKAHLGRMTEDIPEHQGVVIYSTNDIPLGFGVTAKSTEACRKVDPSALTVYHQADVGEYLRSVEISSPSVE